MKKIYFCFSVVYLHFLVVTAALGYVPTFSGQTGDFDSDLTRNYHAFTKSLTSHAVFQPSQAVTNPLMDYVLFLTSYSQDHKVSVALDYMLKTSGPFGFSGKPADEQEKVFLAASAQAITLQHSDLAGKSYTKSEHQDEILRLQGLAKKGNPEHPYHPKITLPARADSLVTSTQGERWQSFLTLITDENLTKRQFAAKKLNEGAKADWLNDVLLCGYLMGLMPDVEDRLSLKVRDYLDESWKKDNRWMELKHNYVQWRFPIYTVGQGDGIAPRTLITTRQTLADHGQVETSMQEMLAASFVRKVTFWGGQLDKSLKIVPLSKAEDKALGTPVAGQTWSENWVIKTHNYLRMDRFLRCLYFFGLQTYVDSLYAFLTKTADAQPAKHGMKESLRRYWSQAKDGKPELAS